MDSGTSNVDNTHFSVSVRRNRRLLKNHESLVALFQVATDILVAASLLFIFTWSKLESFPPAYRVLTVITICSLWFIYSSRGVYRQSSGYVRGCLRLSSAWLMLILLLTFIGFITKTSELRRHQRFSRERSC